MLRRNFLTSEVRDQKSLAINKAERHIKRPHFSPTDKIPDFTQEVANYFLSIFEIQDDVQLGTTEIDYDTFTSIFDIIPSRFYEHKVISITCIKYPLEGQVQSETMLRSIEARLPRNFKIEDNNLAVYCRQVEPNEEFIAKTLEEIVALRRALNALQEEMRKELETTCSEINEEIQKLVDKEIRRREIQDKFKI